MRVTNRTIGAVVILDLEGRLTFEAEVGNLQLAVQELIRQSKGNIILNMERVSSLDCAGIGLLVTACCAVQESGGELKLLYVQEKPLQLLAMAGLLTAIDAYDSEGDAIASFRGPDRPADRFEAVAWQFA